MISPRHPLQSDAMRIPENHSFALDKPATPYLCATSTPSTFKPGVFPRLYPKASPPIIRDQQNSIGDLYRASANFSVKFPQKSLATTSYLLAPNSSQSLLQIFTILFCGPMPQKRTKLNSAHTEFGLWTPLASLKAKTYVAQTNLSLPQNVPDKPLLESSFYAIGLVSNVCVISVFA